MSKVTIKHDSSFGCTHIKLEFEDKTHMIFDWNSIGPNSVKNILKKLGHEVEFLDVEYPLDDNYQDPIYA